MAAAFLSSIQPDLQALSMLPEKHPSSTAADAPPQGAGTADKPPAPTPGGASKAPGPAQPAGPPQMRPHGGQGGAAGRGRGVGAAVMAHAAAPSSTTAGQGPARGAAAFAQGKTAGAAAAGAGRGTPGKVAGAGRGASRQQLKQQARPPAGSVGSAANGAAPSVPMPAAGMEVSNKSRVAAQKNAESVHRSQFEGARAAALSGGVAGSAQTVARAGQIGGERRGGVGALPEGGPTFAEAQHDVPATGVMPEEGQGPLAAAAREESALAVTAQGQQPPMGSGSRGMALSAGALAPALSTGHASGEGGVLAALGGWAGMSEAELECRAQREYLLIKQEILAAQQRELQREWAEAEAKFGVALGSVPPSLTLSDRIVHRLPGRRRAKCPWLFHVFASSCPALSALPKPQPRLCSGHGEVCR
eukprot:scaffold237448_cov17-Tisochrysis_lutea.AAC.1